MTQNYQAAMEAVLAKIKAVSDSAIIGFLPPCGGIAISMSGGEAKTDMIGNSYARLRVTVAVKALSQDICAELLDKAHSALQQESVCGNSWSITGIRVAGAPQLAAQVAQGMWIMQSIVIVKLVSERS